MNQNTSRSELKRYLLANQAIKVQLEYNARRPLRFEKWSLAVIYLFYEINVLSVSDIGDSVQYTIV